jgi:hypothetical protein
MRRDLLKVCLAAIVAGACTQRAPQLVAASDPCAVNAGKRTCTVTISEVDGRCDVLPDTLVIENHDQVVFATGTFTSTEAIEIADKGNTPIVFAAGKPGHVGKGKSFDAGAAAGHPDDAFVYSITFKGKLKQTCPPIDPVICIKSSTGGGCDAFVKWH